MSRSGYSEDCDDEWQLNLYRGTVERATRGKRGQTFLRNLLLALDAMPKKKLIANELQTEDGEVCAIGSLGRALGVDMSGLDPEDAIAVGMTFNIAECLAREVVWINDEASYRDETPERRWSRVREWVVSQIKTDQAQ